VGRWEDLRARMMPGRSAGWALVSGAQRVVAATAHARKRARGREAVGPAMMTDAWSRRDGVWTAGDVGPTRCVGMAPTARRRAQGALRRPSPTTFRCA
jgi:hypothetical protein